MKKLIFFIFPLLKFSLFAQPVFFWAKQQGAGTNYCLSGGIAIDDFGKIYTTGRFTDTADFDPASSVYNLSAHGYGSFDIFISKCDSLDNLIWAKSIGGKQMDEANSLALDKHGNLYITGYFRDTVDFDPDTGVFNLISAGGEDIFICKLDSSGNLVWARSMGGIVAYDYERGVSISIDNKNNVCLTGMFKGTCNFDPGIGMLNLTAIGYSDIFISKLDSSGNLLWVKQIGGTEQNSGNSIVVDSDDNVYVTGYWDTISWNDIFLCKLDYLGNLIWLKHLPGFLANSIALDENRNIYLTGGSGIFICKLDSSGNVIWRKGGGLGYGNSIIINKQGNINIMGTFEGTVDFDYGPGEYYLSSPGNNNSTIFLLELEPKYGNFICAGKMGGATSAHGKQISVDNAGNLYAYGIFTLTADLNPGPDVFEFNAPPIGNYLHGTNAFVTKFSECLINVGENPVVNNNFSFSLYPNPANNSLRISCPANSSSLYFEIKNVAGSTIFNSTLPELNDKTFCTLDISNLSPGLYFIELVAGEMREVEKFVVVR